MVLSGGAFRRFIEGFDLNAWDGRAATGGGSAASMAHPML
jgi:hypothetical protein